MKELRLTVRRSVFKTFLLGMLGLPLVFVAIDYLWGTFGFLEILGDWSYGGKEVEAYEARDDILVGTLGLIGVSVNLFALKEFIAPRRVLVANDDGVHVPLRGPFRRSDGISWYQIKELRADGGNLIIALNSRGELPDDPWNARWEDDTTLRVRATWWDRRPDHVLGRMKALGFKPLIAPEPVFTEELREAFSEARDEQASMLPPEDELDRVLGDMLGDEEE